MSASGLGKLAAVTLRQTGIIGVVLEGFFYGVYSAIFYMYIRYHTSKELGIQAEKRNVLFFLLCVLYMLATTTIVLEIAVSILPSNPGSNLLSFHLFYALSIINGLCDFISEAILIYRCWVIWGCNIRVIIIPSMLALAFLATWLATSYTLLSPQRPLVDITYYWRYPVGLTSLVISLTVNAVVTGLIVLRILKVYWEIRATFKVQTLGVSRAEAKVRSIIFIMIESGMAIFTIQLIGVVLAILKLDDPFIIVLNINEMFNGLIPTIILLRVSMGLSYHDDKSLVETAASWRFAPQNQNSIPENGGVILEMAGQPEERLDSIYIQQLECDDIEIVDR